MIGIDRQRKKADRRFAELVEALGLDATQQASLKAFLDKQLEDLGTMNMMDGGDDMASAKSYAALLRNEGIDDALAALPTTSKARPTSD